MGTELAVLGFRYDFAAAFYNRCRFPRECFRSSKPHDAARIRGSRIPTCRRFSASLVEQLESREEFSFTEQENRLIDALIGVQGRGRAASPQQLQDVVDAADALERVEGVPDPTSSALLEGRWQLMFTTRPGTASPIQRTFVGVDFFTVFQEVYLQRNDPRVSNIVKFSDAIGELKVEAQASSADGKRISFQFDRAAFTFKFLPFKVPYPVPFRLLGDEAKGWLDITYLSESGNIRISRGNKGTTFVLQKKTDPRQGLLSAISTGTGIEKAIEVLISQQTEVSKAESELVEGQWRLLWSSQMETDSWFANASNGLMGMQIVKENGKLQFLVDILFGLKFSMYGTFTKCGTNTYDVSMDDAVILVGNFGLPLEMESKFNIELLYVDDKIRITKGYSGVVFVHLRRE